MLTSEETGGTTYLGMMIDAAVLAVSIVALMVVNMRKACR
jgi:hypothetical protein